MAEQPSLELQRARARARAQARLRLKQNGGGNTPWYGEEPGVAAKVLQGFGSIATGVDDVMSGRVDPRSDQGIANITDAAALTTPASPAARAGYGWMGVKSTKREPVKTPVGEELLKEGDIDYKLARQLDVRYYPKAVQNWAFKLKSKLLKDGFSDKKGSAPLTHGVLSELLKPIESGAFVSIDNLQSIKATLQNAAKDFNKPTDQNAAIEVIQAIDEFIARPDPAAVMAGPAATAGDIWTRATKNYGAGKRALRLVDDPVSLGERAEQGRHVLSAGSTDKTIRDRVGALLTNEKTRAGFSDEELAILKSVEKGNAPRNIVSIVGNWMSTGFATGLSLTAALSALANPVALAGAIPGATVLGAKAIGNALTKRALNKAAEKVAQRSPLYEERAAAAPPVMMAPPSVRAAPGRAAVPLIRNGRAYGPAPAAPEMTPEQLEQYLRWKREGA